MVPKEVWYLVDHLYLNALRTPELFDYGGLHNELIQIRNWLDTSPSEPLRILHTLLLFILSIPLFVCTGAIVQGRTFDYFVLNKLTTPNLKFIVILQNCETC